MRLPHVASGTVGGALIVLALTATAQAGWPRSVVRNDSPQRSVTTVRDEHPIYYPRFGTAPTPADPADQLLRRFLDRHTAMDYEAAAELARQLIELTPQRAAAYYNHACAMGRLHRTDEALVSLRHAIDSGWRDLVHMSLDPDLDSVRSDPRYGELSRHLIELLNVERQAVKRDATTGTPAPPIDFDGAAATVALVDEGQVTWTGPVGAGDRRGLPGPDDRLEIGADMLSVIAMAQLNTPVTRAQPTRPTRPVLVPAANPPLPGAARSGRIDGPGMIEAVEAATGMTFDDYCRRHILEPYGMTSTRFARPLVVESTARDLARLLASCAGGTEGFGGPEVGFGRSGVPTPVALELSHHGRHHQVVLRWDPDRRRGVVVVSTGDGTARRIARLALGGAVTGR